MRLYLRNCLLAFYLMLVFCFLSVYKNNITFDLYDSSSKKDDDPHSSSDAKRQYYVVQTRSNKTRSALKDKIKRRRIWPEEWDESDRVLEQIDYVPKTKLSRDLIIHLPHGLGSWNVRDGRQMFIEEQCKVQNCLLSDKRLDAESADAIMFRNQVYEAIRNRPPNQIWIFYSLESPENTPSVEGSSVSAINWTATYKWTSDLVTPYEKLDPIYLFHEKSVDKSSSQQPQRNFARGKTKQVAWFVSNCFTTNNRRKYAEDLGKHIQVDIYGNCGQQKCTRNDQKCTDMLDSEYRFYLAFENSNCKEYITEKFLATALTHDVIPIVMGARRQDYERVAPADSFVHVDDFESPEALAAHLLHLSQNDTAYNQYFRWKPKQQREAGRQSLLINTKFWCRLCALLNEPRPKVYADLNQWWHAEDVCAKDGWKTTKQPVAAANTDQQLIKT